MKRLIAMVVAGVIFVVAPASAAGDGNISHREYDRIKVMASKHHVEDLAQAHPVSRPAQWVGGTGYYHMVATYNYIEDNYYVQIKYGRPGVHSRWRVKDKWLCDTAC